MSLQDFLDALHGGLGGLGVAEGGQADIALAAGAEARAGGGSHVGLVQQQVEKLPGTHFARRFQPDIGGVGAAEAAQTGGAQALPDDFGVFPVVLDGLAGLFLALRGVDGRRAPLDT